jgi:hypothetical protein
MSSIDNFLDIDEYFAEDFEDFNETVDRNKVNNV